MTQRRDVMTIVVFTAFALIASSDSSRASCFNPAPPRKRLAMAAAVFEGYVVDLELDTNWIPPDEVAADRCTGRLVGAERGASLCLSSSILVTFEVTKVWKGVDGGRVPVSTEAPSVKCRYPPPQIGDLYLVYAFRAGEGTGLTIDCCTPAETGHSRLAALKELGAPTSDMFEERSEREDPRR